MLSGVTVLVWDHDNSLVSGQHNPKEESSAVDPRRQQRRSQQRSSRERKAPTLDPKLKKKLASLEETETKTKTGCSKKKKT